MAIYDEMPMDSAEDVENYTPGGLHPVMINQLLDSGRYKVLHKLGSGGLATVWLARDLQYDSHRSSAGPLVSLKVQRADESPENADESPEIVIPRKLASLKPDLASHLLLPAHAFLERGPNGTHLCVTSELAGSNLWAITDCPGRTRGTRRLRGDIARKVSGQVAHFVCEMHSAGFVHGDLKSSNILLRLKEKVCDWSDERVYEVFGEPDTCEVERLDGQPPGAHAPSELVENIPAKAYVDADLLGEQALIIDFGKSFEILDKPSDYRPAAAANYRAPEMRFENAYTTATDVWSLGCLLFEIRGGEPLFENWFCTDDMMVNRIVKLLGKLPEPWWSSWTARSKFYHDDGKPLEGPNAQDNEIRMRLRGIGEYDFESKFREGGGVIEQSGARLNEEEIALLGDLLENMLCLRPEDRITMGEVVRHPWFVYHSTISAVDVTNPASTRGAAAAA